MVSPAQAPAPPPVPFIWAEGGARGVEEEVADGRVFPEITGASSEVTNWVSACLSYSTQIQMRTCAPTHPEHPPSPRALARPHPDTPDLRGVHHPFTSLGGGESRETAGRVEEKQLMISSPRAEPQGSNQPFCAHKIPGNTTPCVLSTHPE